METAPRIGFRPHLAVETIPGEGVYLVSDRGTVVISGPGVEAVAPLLDGTRTVVQVQRELAPSVTPGQVLNVVGRLTEADLITERREPGEADPAVAAYWDLAGLDPDQAGAALAGHRVRVEAPASLAAAVAAECRAAGLAVVSGAGDPDTFTLAFCDDYLEPDLAALSARLRAEGSPWLPVKPTGTEIWIGPVFGAPDGPCLSCLATRVRGHRVVESYLRAAAGHHRLVRPPDAALPTTRSLALRVAVLEAVKWLAGHRGTVQDQLITLDTLTLESRRHPVARRPQCPDCGDPGLVADLARRPVRTASRPKAAGGGNGHRAVAAAEHWERYGHLADPLTGVVDGIRRDPGSPPFVNCYLAGPNLATMGASGLNDMRAGLRHHSGGKGATDLEARVSALSEAVERYCGAQHGDELVVRDSRAGLGSAALHPNEVMLFHDRQYQDRVRWNADQIVHQRVPEPFDDHVVTEWTPVWSLIDSARRLLPTQLLYFHRPGQLTGDVFARADSNGNAAGTSVEDAIVQGFLELVERDAVALWWYNRTRHRGVDLGTLHDPWIDELIERYRGIGRDLWVLDLTADLDIPVMAAISRRTGGPGEEIMMGFGAHFDPAVAVRRALSEHGQLLSAVPASSGGQGPLDRQLRSWWSYATVANQPYLLPSAAEPLTTLRGHRGNGDLSDDIADIRALARRRDLDVLVLDQTRPDIGMPVVKVIAPGLRHFWARFAPGRLWDVPVELGRLETPTAYEDLNPIPLFL
jgi:bacteriocin biosynthesis cyclodehydratase domain-containing protein